MNTNNTNGFKILFEFLGTFILSLGINHSTSYSNGSQVGNPILIISSFFAAITLTRTVSGGHINPAVSVAVFLSKPADIRNKEQPLLTLYILSQVMGAISACLFSYIFYKENVFQLAVNPTSDPFHAFSIEVIGTFIFIYTILCQGNMIIT
jgi:aquaporin Z